MDIIKNIHTLNIFHLILSSGDHKNIISRLLNDDV